MHSIKNISERNKIDTQSWADAYISLDAPKSFLETEKNPKTLSSGQMYKKTKKNKNPKTPPKTPKKPLGFFF